MSRSGAMPAVTADRTSRACPTDKVFVADLCGDCRIATYFVCETKEVATTRDGRAFLKLVLRDASGDVKALHFDPSDDMIEDLCAGDVVKVVGNYTVSPQYGPQIKIQQLATLEEGDYDAAALVAVSPVPREALERRLGELIAVVRRPWLRELLARALDPGAEPGATYRVAPAAVRHHHAYLHGLLEHSVVVAEVALSVARRTPTADRDMVVTGALLHDLGKTLAYSTDPFRPGLTDKGRLQGEIVLGQSMVADLLRELAGAPDEGITRLLHIIVSHHGEREKGSPAPPMTREAVIVHYCDDMTARLAAFDEAEAGTPASEKWTSFNRMMETMLFLGAAGAAAEDGFGVEGADGPRGPAEAEAYEPATQRPAITGRAQEAEAAEERPAKAATDGGRRNDGRAAEDHADGSRRNDDAPPAVTALFD